MNAQRPTPEQAWNRLVTAARRHRPEGVALMEDVRAPLGFATRVCGRAELRSGGGLFAGAGFDRLAARAFGAACACALAVMVWSSVPTSLEAQEADDLVPGWTYVDPLGAIVEAVQSS